RSWEPPGTVPERDATKVAAHLAGAGEALGVDQPVGQLRETAQPVGDQGAGVEKRLCLSDSTQLQTSGGPVQRGNETPCGQAGQGHNSFTHPCNATPRCNPTARPTNRGLLSICECQP